MSLVSDLIARGVLDAHDVALLKSVFRDTGLGDNQTFAASAQALRVSAASLTNTYLPQLDALRKVFDALYPSVTDVDSFGAKGDGTTDDTAAVQAAVDALGPHGGVVEFGPKTYKCNITLPADSNVSVTLRGSGSVVATTGAETGGTILKPAVAGTDCISATQTTSCNPTYQVENMTLVGPDTGATATSGHGLAFLGSAGVPRVILRNLYIAHFKGTGKAGLYVSAAEDSLISAVHVTRCYYGYYTLGAFNGNTVINPMMDTCTYGWLFDDGGSCHISGGVIQSNVKSGLTVLTGVGLTFSGVHFENNNTSSTSGEYAVKIAGATNKPCQSIIFSTCDFETANDKIYANGAAGWTATGIRIMGGYAAGVNTPIVTWGAYAIACSIEDFCNANQISDSGSGNRIIELTGGKHLIPALGVANAASGSTPGSCVKKIQVYDASGTSLGYIPVYDAIT